MPPEALSRRRDPTEPFWGPLEELLTQLVEEVSVMVAQKARKQPRQMWRPPSVAQSQRRHSQVSGIAGILAQAQKRGVVRHG